MSQPLPKGFLWGNSTSSMQTEGGIHEGGKGQSVYDIRPATENSMDWSVTIDEYHRYEEDFDLMQQMGMNAIASRSHGAAWCLTATANSTKKASNFTANKSKP
nr:family 1 glycosylhydrolase [Lacticaseibacillus manihotivorans]